MIAYGLVVDGAFYPYIDDFVTRTKYINLGQEKKFLSLNSSRST